MEVDNHPVILWNKLKIRMEASEFEPGTYCLEVKYVKTLGLNLEVVVNEIDRNELGTGIVRDWLSKNECKCEACVETEYLFIPFRR